MKLYEIAQKAITEQNARLAHNLAELLTVRHGLNRAGIAEYLGEHGVDSREFEEILKSERSIR